jgi:four helix bundle protein
MESAYDISGTGSTLEVRETKSKYKIDLCKRIFDFSVNCFKILNQLPYKKEYDIFRIQVSKSCTSIGANYEESQASSIAEFRQRIQICLRESRETHYWLKLMKAVHDTDNSGFKHQIDRLIQESLEIKRIFGAISAKVKGKS